MSGRPEDQERPGQWVLETFDFFPDEADPPRRFANEAEAEKALDDLLAPVESEPADDKNP